MRGPQEALQRGEGGGVVLLGEEVPGARDHMAADERGVGGERAPDLERARRVAPDHPALSPQHQARRGDPLTGGRAGGVVFQVDRRPGPVVLDHRVPCGGVGEDALVLAQRLRRLGVQPAAPAVQRAVQEVQRVAADEPLGQLGGLDEEEPVVVGGGDRPVEVDVGRGQDVQQREARHPVRVVERHPVRHTGAAVVADHGEPVEAERRHQRDLVRGHRLERVPGVVVARGRPARVAVAAQVRRDDGAVAGQLGGDPVPHDVALREAVQQQDGRPVAAADRVDAHAGSGDVGHLDVDRLEPRPEHAATVARPVATALRSHDAAGGTSPPQYGSEVRLVGHNGITVRGWPRTSTCWSSATATPSGSR